jgi:hypothetical protein
VNTTPPDSYGYVVDCGIVDHPPADCSRMTATAVAHQGIFENPFADEWTELELESQAHTAIIDQVIKLCDFPADHHGEVYLTAAVVSVSSCCYG